MKSDDEDSSGSDTDYAFQEDMEALKRACLLTGSNPDSIDFATAGKDTDDNVVSRGGVPPVNSSSSDDDDDDDVEDDFKLVRDIQKRFHQLKGEPLIDEHKFSISSVCSDNEEEDDDFETLRAIQRRFAAYGASRTQESIEKAVSKSEQVGVTNIHSEKETSSNCFVESSNAWEGFPDCVDKSSSTTQSPEACNTTAAGSCPSEFIDQHIAADDDSDIGPVKGSSFPKCGRAFIDAIKKNRSCQQLIRSRLLHAEARIEEIKKLKDRVKILKDYQISCKVRTGRALAQKKDPRVQLISAMKPITHSKVNGKSSAMNYGPAENSQAAIYRKALDEFPIFIKRETWSSKEKENLAKGVRQQVQEILVQRLLDSNSNADVDSVISFVRNRDFTPEEIRGLLREVNWDAIAGYGNYVPNRSGAECQTRWLNFEDPLINNSPWSTEEDKDLLRVVQLKGLSNWMHLAASLGTRRTPFQCLARYQRSLNVKLIKREWTKEEDNQLRAAVEAFGECDWQAVASSMEGRTGTQCSNRWIKSLHPSRQKVGKWTEEEDERLKVAVMLFGPKTWRKVADSLPGRTHVQCRERWVNSLDPSLSLTGWTVEEDEMLKEAIHEHGYCWSKVATCVPARTDNQCWRRWKTLCPGDVPLLQAARKIQRDALVSNFVDRESERSSLRPDDFVPQSKMDCSLSLIEWKDESAAADTTKSDLCNEEAPRLTNGFKAGNKKRQIPFRKKQSDLCNEEGPRSTNGTKAGRKSMQKKKRKIPLRKKRNTKEFKLIDEDTETENSMSSLSDANLPNTKSHERPSKLQPRRKCRDRKVSRVVDHVECFSSSDDDPSLPNGEVGRKNEDAKSHKKLQPRKRKRLDRQDNEVVENGESISSFDVGRNNEDAKSNKRPSKLQPRKRKRLNKQESEVVENGECLSSFDDDPNLLMSSPGKNAADDLFSNDNVAEISYPNQAETEDGNKTVQNEKVAIIVYRRRKGKKIQVQQNNSCPSPKPMTTSGSITPASILAECGTAAKASGSSKAAPSNSPEHKRSRRVQARDYLNKMMEEDDDISLASYIQHIKRLKRKGTSKGVEGN